MRAHGFFAAGWAFAVSGALTAFAAGPLFLPMIELALGSVMLIASGMETRSAETERLSPKGDSPASEAGDAQHE